jgi:hypothetical protein
MAIDAFYDKLCFRQLALYLTNVLSLIMHLGIDKPPLAPKTRNKYSGTDYSGVFRDPFPLFIIYR